MTPEHLLAFNLALVAAWASPGPAMLLALRATLAGGRRAGMATGCGLAVVAAGWTGLALAGLHTALALLPAAFLVLKITGAAYLVWIAWETWRDARAPIFARRMPGRRAFLDGMIVNIGNPKSFLFAAAVLVVIFPPGLSLAEKALVAANHLFVEVAAYGTLAALIGARPIGLRYLAAKAWLDRAAALVLGGLGLRLLLERP
jgi:threonine/homoserine/homoserine lactone efflux protein